MSWTTCTPLCESACCLAEGRAGSSSCQLLHGLLEKRGATWARPSLLHRDPFPVTAGATRGGRGRASRSLCSSSPCWAAISLPRADINIKFLESYLLGSEMQQFLIDSVASLGLGLGEKGGILRSLPILLKTCLWPLNKRLSAACPTVAARQQQAAVFTSVLKTLWTVQVTG